MTDLTDLKTYLGIGSDNTDYESLLELIRDNTELQLQFKLGLVGRHSNDGVPEELAYIPFQVCVKRFNRLKNEGMTSYAQEGESITFETNDFDEFQSDIDDWKRQHNTSVLTTFDPYRKRGV